MDDLLKEFIIECNEGLAKLDQDLLVLEQNPEDAEVLKCIFRVLHSVKGTGGMLGLSRLETVAHAAEDVLGCLRDGRMKVTSGAIDLILKAVDVIKGIIVNLEATGREPAGEDGTLVSALQGLIGKVDAVKAEGVPAPARSQAAPDPAVEAGEEGKATRSVAEQSLRVHLDVLDRLMNLVGELVLTRNQLVQLVRGDDESKYMGPIQQLNRITSGLQESVMNTRMQPIGNAWGKLPRIVRDLAAASGKQIQLVMNGQETEIDRQVLQAIQDPLVHCVRNSADHGLEDAEQRVAKGKPAQGTVHLNAFHEGGQIIIEIRDDGRGIDLEKVKHRALQKGLLRQDDADRMSEQKIMDLIFEPGFSTAEKVTEISGRGVGMDVVRTNVEQIGGAVEIQSVKDIGTTIRIKIPLTLAIVSALIVKVGAETFAIPQVGVVELVRICETNHHLIEKINNSSVLRLRDKLIPLIDLARFLGRTTDEMTEYSIVVAKVNEVEFGLVVNEVFDTQEIVVKPVGRALRDINLFAGSTILGDGRVIIILDIGRIAARADLLKSSEQMPTQNHEQSKETPGKREETAAMLLFRSGQQAPKAVPLALVSRLEEFRAEEIEDVEDRLVVQYRNGLLPLVPVQGCEIPRDGRNVPTIIFAEKGRTMGLAVSEVTDIVEASLMADSAGRKPGVLCAAIIRERATELIDVDFYLKKAFPEGSFAKRRETSAASKRVLFVEDSAFFQNLILPALEEAGYSVTLACDGREALKELERGCVPDIVLSDIEMPHLDGYDLADRLRSDSRWSHLPLIALTSLSSEEAQAKALAVGFDQFLTKFDRDLLLSVLEKHLSQGVDRYQAEAV